jgi:hypothetical protein
VGDDTPTGPPPTTFDPLVAAVARVEPLSTLAPGQVLDLTYELVERLGGGGMGIVFRARDHRLGRDVAVKALRATGGPEDDHLRRLFEREARATAQLLHPNIVTLHHVGEHAGHPYLVLELLTGETLAARLGRRRKLAVDEALAILDDVLGALAFAHEHGVLHRDLKPNNVFVTADERIKVLDFGVALAMDTDPGPITRAAGTPGYMAPEQRDGGDQDERTDVWAAALLLLECLIGRRPDERDLRGALVEVEAPNAVRDALGRALAFDPARRPGSAAALRGELARAAGKLAPPRRRWRVPAIVIAIALLAATAGSIVTTFATRGRSHAGAAVTAEELNSRAWHVNFGELRVHVDDDGTAYGVYDQKEGIQAGKFENGTWSGWWCQAPTRQAPDNAGPFVLHFVRGDERILVEGEYKYGDGRAASWQKDFYGVEISTPPSYTLEMRMQHHEECPGHPTR